jgi:hypothetical protein
MLRFAAGTGQALWLPASMWALIRLPNLPLSSNWPETNFIVVTPELLANDNPSRHLTRRLIILSTKLLFLAKVSILCLFSGLLIV